jgi:NAD(P)-dependent dehydrogenase (short-subunit alcohol dehydrogenase family)
MADVGERASLGGRNAAVVGGASGIGEAVTRALCESGVAVTFCDHNADAVEITAASLRQAGCHVRGTVADALDPSALEDFHQAVGQELDIVVNVVGGTRHGYFADSTPESRGVDIDRNYGYILRSCHRALPLLRAGRPGGSIINFTTIEAFRGAAGWSVYAGAKAAVTNFSRALAVELGPERIRVNCVAPDTTPTEGNMLASPQGLRDQAATASPELMAEAVKMYIPLQSPPAMDDIANAVLFLAGDLSAAVTGTTIHVDGGTWAASGFINWPFGDWLPVANPVVAQKIFGDRPA